MAKKEKKFYKVRVYATVYTDYGAEDDEYEVPGSPFYRWAVSEKQLLSRLTRMKGFRNRVLDKDMGDLGRQLIKYRFEIEETKYKKHEKHSKNFEVISILDLPIDDED